MTTIDATPLNVLQYITVFRVVIVFLWVIEVHFKDNTTICMETAFYFQYYTFSVFVTVHYFFNTVIKEKGDCLGSILLEGLK